MIPTIPYIQSRFDEFNARYFNGSLPPVPIKLSHAKGFLGKLTFTRRKQGLFRGYRNEDFVLRINARIDLPEELVQDTILHEMIHYYIAVNNLKDSSTHGALFRREMARINAEGGRHITVSHRLTETERAQAVVHKTRMVAVVHFKDGKTGVKMVPNRREYVLYWQRMALRRFAIDKIEWHLTDDDYFAKFPSSVAMKIYLIEDLSVLPVSGTINMG
ncbi:MAG: SprT-like domain-containing protein [Paludibacteraceae bacterium]|nr:SprT-like domain-containing protein [Paludibacteraceae bacterium]